MYVVLVLVIAAAAWNAIRGDDTTDAALGAAVLAFVVQQQFLFPIAEIDPVFWLLAGIVVARVGNVTMVPVARQVARVAATCLGVIGLMVAVVGVRHLAADRLALDAVRSTDSTVAVDQVMRAIDLAPHDVRHRLLLVSALAEQRTVTGVDQAIASIADAVRLDRTISTRTEQARLLSLRASIIGDADAQLVALEAWQQLVADAPSCQRCAVGVAQAAAELSSP